MGHNLLSHLLFIDIKIPPAFGRRNSAAVSVSVPPPSVQTQGFLQSTCSEAELLAHGMVCSFAFATLILPSRSPKWWLRMELF